MKIKAMIKMSMITAVSITALAACGSQKDAGINKTKAINWMQPTNLMSLDPSKADDTVSGNTLGNVDQGLLVGGSGNKITPGIAKSYSISKDGKTYTFHLRDAKWSDGKAVTAKDFVYGFQRTVNPKTASQEAYLYDHVQNYAAIKAGKMAATKLGVSAPNDHTFVVKLSAPQPYFKYLVTESAFLPQSESAVKKFGKKYGTNSASQVYNGPFVAKGWTGTNDSWSIAKNKYYWNASKVKMNKINFSVVKDPSTALSQYQTGKLDAMTLSSKQQVNQYKHSKEYHPYKAYTTNYIELNQQKVAAFKNVKIRKALSMIIDRNQLVNDVLGDGSTKSQGIVGTGLATYKGQDFATEGKVNDAVSYNPTKAKQLWKEGMKEIGKKSLKISLMSADDNTTAKSITEFAQSQLEKLPGLNITTIDLPKQQRIAREFAGNFEMVVMSWSPTYSDPMAALTVKISNNSMNFAKWNNKQYDADITKANGTDVNKPDKRWADLVAAAKVFGNDQGAIPLYQNATPTIMKSNIKGVDYNPAGIGFDFENAYVTK